MAELSRIVALLIGVATLALIIGRYQGTVAVIGASTSGLNELLRTVTLQNSGFGSRY